MSILQRLLALLPPLTRYRPIALACGVALAIVVAIGIAVLQLDADPTRPTSAADDVVLAAGAVQGYNTASDAAELDAAPLQEDGDRQVIEPSPTPRVIHRPQVESTVAPAVTPSAVAVEMRAGLPAQTATTTAAKPVLAEDLLVVNRGFEEPDGWYTERGAAIAAGEAHNGDRYLLIKSNGGYAGQRFTVEAGATYRVALWVRVPDGDARARIGVRFEDARYRAVSSIDSVSIETTAGAWSKVVFTFTVPAGASRGLISFSNAPGGAPISVDDVSVRAYVAE